VPDIPDTVEFIVLTNSLSMALCVMPQLPIVRTSLQMPFGVVLGGVIYVLVMPHLSELRRLGGCDFRGCLPDLLPVPSTNTGRRQGGGVGVARHGDGRRQ
jgi:hypothetical protein